MNQDTKLYEHGCAWVDGEFVPIHEARIPLLDTGFIRSDVTYDTVAVWAGNFFRLDDHLARFEGGIQKLRMNPSLTLDEMRQILFGCVRRTGLKNAYVQMILSRGTAPPGSRDPRLFQNRFYAYAIPYVWILTPEKVEEGLHLIIAKDVIRTPPKAIDPTVKNFQWGDLVRGLYEAYDRGGHNVVLCDGEGHLTEGPGFNLFAVYNNILYTPASGVLLGVTRQTVLDIAQEMEVETRVESFKANLLYEADEILISSTAGGIMPVTRLDNKPVGDGKPGELTMSIHRRYWEEHTGGKWTTPVDDPVDDPVDYGAR